MKSRIVRIVLLCLSLFAAPAFAQDSAYTEGSVTQVSSIKVADGQFENYLAYLQKNWKSVMEEAKKAGAVAVILSIPMPEALRQCSSRTTPRGAKSSGWRAD